jgi:hypothetical protein
MQGGSMISTGEWSYFLNPSRICVNLSARSEVMAPPKFKNTLHSLHVFFIGCPRFAFQAIP